MTLIQVLCHPCTGNSLLILLITLNVAEYFHLL